MKLGTISKIREIYEKGGITGCWNSFLSVPTSKTHPKKVLYQPTDIQIEPTSKCNLNCLMCGRRFLSRKNGNMSLEVFRKIIGQFPFLRWITLQGVGEPLLNPDLFDMIEFAKAKKIRVRFSSNGTLLTNEKIQKIFASRLDYLTISMDGATSKTYNEIRSGANFSSVLDNIKNLMETKKKLREDNLVVAIDMVAMRSNLEDLPKLVELVHSLDIKKLNVRQMGFQQKDNYVNKDTKDQTQLINESLFFEDSVKTKNIFRRAQKLSEKLDIELHLPTSSKNTENFLCRWPWLKTYITFDGYVTPCCVCPDKDEISFGNILEHSFKEIWNSKKYQDFRSKVISSEVPDTCQECMRPINLYSSFS
ncbi:MAG: radical SAM protein [Candidatus Hodarchaeales archaeon]|jgi:radical SAM protein with 4Fe4S-binding SPASM domain